MAFRIGIIVLLIFAGCGKVAQDISSQTNKSIFKEATFTFDFSSTKDMNWNVLITSANVSSVYSYFTGLKFDQGYEKIGWVEAKISEKDSDSKPLAFTLTNYDLKKNLVKTSRYQQGFISFQTVSTHNYRTQTQFRKVRPKYDYYSFAHFLNKDTYVFFVSEKIPTSSVSISSYQHLMSAIFLKHLTKESYNRDTAIPLSFFYSIIPDTIITPTLNVTPKNTVKTFYSSRPLFVFKSPLFDSLLATVTLAYHSDEYDVVDYIRSNETVFPTPMKEQLIESVKTYYKTKKADVVTTNLTTITN